MRWACWPSTRPRGSSTISLVPRLAACLNQVAATGWFTVGLQPVRRTTSACATCMKEAVTAPEPMHSISAATELAWHSRVQWSTLLEPKPVRTSFWNSQASSFEHFALPKPASTPGPWASSRRRRPAAAKSSASSQLAGRKWVSGLAGSKSGSTPLGAPARRISGVVRRPRWLG